MDYNLSFPSSGLDNRSSTNMSSLLDQYQAALHLGISPELLQHFTSYTMKKNCSRKLQVAKREGNLIFFDVVELDNYDAWLRAPWPAEPKQRPYLPKAIKEELRSEAAGECALCHKNGNSCEAAHITPVAISKCNHPHYLLWLCANHHTKFDHGFIGPKGASNKLIQAAKLMVLSAKRHIWQHTAEVSTQLAALLKLANDLHTDLKDNPSSSAEVEVLGKQLLKLLPDIASNNRDEEIKPVLDRITATVSNISITGDQEQSSTEESLELIGSFEQEFLEKAGLKDCPLCFGTRWHNDQECPICQGEGSIPKDSVPDLDPFQNVPCRLCSGRGHINRHTCLACSGEGSMESRFDEKIDWEQFEEVTCSLCQGSGRFHEEECPICSGEQLVHRGVLAQVDPRDFEHVNCPLCDGRGWHDGVLCPVCFGDRQIQKQYAEKVDRSLYIKENCALCTGTGSFFNGDCPVCQGDRLVERRQNTAIDMWDYQLVACPNCKGSGCDICDSRGQLPRRFANGG